ncbi:MAG: hypothetical protein COA86_08590 [Kangiella sp.]|nr:MAG: hypothetical protein COA86_08590 [Kangiella sp.]
MKIENTLKIATSATLFFMLSACFATIPPLIRMADHPIDGRSDNLETSNMKIVLLSGKHRNIAKPLQSDFRDVVSEVITNSGSEVVDRDIASTLIDELNLSSLDSDNLAAYEGPEVADYVIIANLKRSASSSSYQKAITISGKDGKSFTTPAFCSYKGNVKGTVDVRELPSLKRIDLINVQGSKTSIDTGVINRHCNKRDMKEAAINSALNDTFVKGTSAYVNLTNYVGAKAYIIGAKKHDGKFYLETNLGRALGAEKGALVNIFEIIRGKLVRVAEAEFLGDDNIYSDGGFLDIDEDDFPKIRKGMIVKISGDCSGFGCMGSLLKGMPSIPGL